MGITKTLIWTITFVIASHAAYRFYTKKPKSKKIKRQEINDVIIFCNKNPQLGNSKYLKVYANESVDRLFEYLNCCRHSLDICMYVLTNTEVTNLVLRHHLRGIKVRVILDADMAFTSGSTVKRLEKHGVHVRWMKSTDIMHHKFCLIDTVGPEDCVPFVMTGSLNWTNQALYRNWENVVITSQKDIVDKYRAEYERIWHEFKPIVRIGR